MAKMWHRDVLLTFATLIFCISRTCTLKSHFENTNYKEIYIGPLCKNKVKLQTRLIYCYTNLELCSKIAQIRELGSCFYLNTFVSILANPLKSPINLPSACL